MFGQAAIVKGRNRDTAWFAAIDSEWPALKEAFKAWLNPSNFDVAGQQTECLSESPRVYWRVKLSKDEPHGTEKIPPEVHG